MLFKMRAAAYLFGKSDTADDLTFEKSYKKTGTFLSYSPSFKDTQMPDDLEFDCGGNSGCGRRIYTVTQISNEIKLILEDSCIFQHKR
jgi:hypothetical protein